MTAVPHYSAIHTTYLAHIISHTIRPACLTLIHHSATSIAFTRAPNH